MPSMSGPERLFCRSAPWVRWTRKVVLPWALQEVQLHGDVLEVGAGSGSMALGTLDAHPDARLTLTDVDPEMVAATRRRFAGHPHVAVREADVTRLPFPDGSFDYVVSYLMLHHVVGWDRAMVEMHRVLRPGGRLVGYDLTHTGLARLVHLVDRSPHRLLTPDELETGLSIAGFAEVHLRTDFAGHVMRFTATATATTATG